MEEGEDSLVQLRHLQKEMIARMMLYGKVDQLTAFVTTIAKLITNILQFPTKEFQKLRRIRVKNPWIEKSIFGLKDGPIFLQSIGWERVVDERVVATKTEETTMLAGKLEKGGNKDGEGKNEKKEQKEEGKEEILPFIPSEKAAAQAFNNVQYDIVQEDVFIFNPEHQMLSWSDILFALEKLFSSFREVAYPDPIPSETHYAMSEVIVRIKDEMMMMAQEEGSNLYTTTTAACKNKFQQEPTTTTNVVERREAIEGEEKRKKEKGGIESSMATKNENDKKKHHRPFLVTKKSRPSLNDYFPNSMPKEMLPQQHSSKSDEEVELQGKNYRSPVELEDASADERRLNMVRQAVQYYGQERKGRILAHPDQDQGPHEVDEESDDDDALFTSKIKDKEEKYAHMLPLTEAQQAEIYQRIEERYRVYYNAQGACHLGLQRYGGVGEKIDKKKKTGLSNEEKEIETKEEELVKKSNNSGDGKNKEQQREHFLSQLPKKNSAVTEETVHQLLPQREEEEERRGNEIGENKTTRNRQSENDLTAKAMLYSPEVMCNQALQMVLLQDNDVDVEEASSGFFTTPQQNLQKSLHILNQLDFRNLLEAEIVQEVNRVTMQHLQTELFRTMSCSNGSSGGGGLVVENSNNNGEEDDHQLNKNDDLQRPPPPQRPAATASTFESSHLQILLSHLLDSSDPSAQQQPSVLDNDEEIKSILLTSLAIWQADHQEVSGAIHSLQLSRKIARQGLLPKLELVALYNMAILQERSRNYDAAISTIDQAGGGAIQLAVSLGDKAMVVQFLACRLRCYVLKRDEVGVLETLQKVSQLAWPSARQYTGPSCAPSADGKEGKNCSPSGKEIQKHLEEMEMTEKGSSHPDGIGHIFSQQFYRSKRVRTRRTGRSVCKNDHDDKNLPEFYASQQQKGGINPASSFEEIFGRNSIGSVASGAVHPLPKAVTALTIYGKFRVFSAPILSCAAGSWTSATQCNVFMPLWSLVAKLEREGLFPPTSFVPSSSSSHTDESLGANSSREIISSILRWIAVEATMPPPSLQQQTGERRGEGEHVGIVRYEAPFIAWVLWMQMTPDRNVLIPAAS